MIIKHKIRIALLSVLIFSGLVQIFFDKIFANEQNIIQISAKAEMLPQKVLASDLQSRPDIIMEAYAKAYPDKIKRSLVINDEWGIEMTTGQIFYWANGRMLPQEKLNDWEEYRSYQVYAYRGTPRDPSKYTAETIEWIEDYTSPEKRAKPALPQHDGLLNALFDVGTRASTEQQITKTNLFGHTVSVHKAIVPAIRAVDERVKKIAAKNTEVASFLEKINSVSGYNWRVIEGTTRRSNHSYGLAVDVLPVAWHQKMLYWLWVRDFNKDWITIPQDKLWTPPAEVIKTFEDEGFIWGGTWPFFDTMHFEYRPELIQLKERIIFDN